MNTFRSLTNALLKHGSDDPSLVTPIILSIDGELRIATVDVYIDMMLETPIIKVLKAEKLSVDSLTEWENKLGINHASL